VAGEGKGEGAWFYLQIPLKNSKTASRKHPGCGSEKGFEKLT
jgi:hypothetical protein